MATPKKSGAYLKLLIYMAVIVLVNIAGITLFFRADLTQDRVYSLSEASKKVVSTLEEPLTVKVFFTKNLPAPHNNTERYLHDLLEEYAIFGKRNFNYDFYDVSSKEGDVSEMERENRELANNYGIFPVQIQAVERDEVKFQKAYMGMVLIHGDLIEKVPTITATDGLEYKISSAIMKMNHKTSKLLGLKEKIRVNLFLSASLKAVAPYLQLQDLDRLPEQVHEIVKKLNATNYGKLEFQHMDTTADPGLSADAERYAIMSLKWPELPEKNIAAGSGNIGLVLKYQEDSRMIPILQVMKIPMIGTHYQLVDPGQLEEMLTGGIESLIHINADLGLLADHGTFGEEPPNPMGRPQSGAGISTFKSLVGQSYTIKDVKLKEALIPEGIQCLVVARPTEKLDDYALYQIDQFLMRGNNLAVFLDPFKETMPQGQNMMFGGQGPAYLPLDTGLEKLLAHYGVRIHKSIVLDEECFRQSVGQEMGGGERRIYFAPLIQNENIAHDLDFMKNIKGLVVLKAAPLDVDAERTKQIGVQAHRLFSSSKKSWEMKDNLNLNPMFMSPPPATGESRQSFALAYLLEGAFPSYFEGKPKPERTIQKEDPEKSDETNGENTADAPKPQPADPVVSRIEDTGAFIAKGKPGKIFIMAASDMITDSVLDEEGRSPNAVFIQNVVDTLNGRNEVAVLRGKSQSFNPLREIDAASKLAIKAFNIVGLPMLTVLFGLLIWMRRASRKKRIQMMFEPSGRESNP